MRDKKLLIYSRIDLEPCYAELPIETIKLRHLHTRDLSKLHPTGIVAFFDKERVKILIKNRLIVPQNTIVSADEFAEIITETFL